MRSWPRGRSTSRRKPRLGESPRRSSGWRPTSPSYSCWMQIAFIPMKDATRMTAPSKDMQSALLRRLWKRMRRRARRRARRKRKTTQKLKPCEKGLRLCWPKWRVAEEVMAERSSRPKRLSRSDGKLKRLAASATPCPRRSAQSRTSRARRRLVKGKPRPAPRVESSKATAPLPRKRRRRKTRRTLKSASDSHSPQGLMFEGLQALFGYV
mmetsp:Transcript_71060/g.166649  ORF Transcript_71060/g.166649 Transcript_71060/m.166649 type:complete len:210 (+) Transcript_71060:141-770(+)